MSDVPEVWFCLNNKSDGILGYIEYYPHWKQMCLLPLGGTVLNDKCLKDIAHFLDQLNMESS